MLMKRIFTLMIVGLALVWLGCPARSIFPLLTPAEHVISDLIPGENTFNRYDDVRQVRHDDL